MKNKNFSLTIMLAVLFSVKAFAFSPKVPKDSSYFCEVEFSEELKSFKLDLQYYNYRAFPDHIQFAKITTEEGNTFSGKFTTSILGPGTRLSGTALYEIQTVGELGNIKVDLVKTSSPFGSGTIKFGESEKEILVNCKPL